MRLVYCVFFLMGVSVAEVAWMWEVWEVQLSFEYVQFMLLSGKNKMALY